MHYQCTPVLFQLAVRKTSVPAPAACCPSLPSSCVLAWGNPICSAWVQLSGLAQELGGVLLACRWPKAC